MFSGKVFGAVAGATVLALSATGAFAQAKDKVKVGFIYVGPIGDHGWSYQHDQGRLAIEKAFPGKVTTTFPFASEPAAAKTFTSCPSRVSPLVRSQPNCSTLPPRWPRMPSRSWMH